MQVKTTGIKETVAALGKVAAGGRASNGLLAGAALTVPWGGFLETGKDKRGRVRRAGPAWMFRDGGRAATPQVQRLVADAVPKGPQAVGQAKAKGEKILVNEIRSRTPVRTGYTQGQVQPIKDIRGAG